MNKEFPDGFLIGAATAAHQVEGDNHNQWSAWEELNAGRLAKQAEIRYFHNPNTRESAINLQNYISGDACDHYNLYREDLMLLKELGMNSYRFSIEWSRICPEIGVIDQAEIQHYREMLEFMRHQGITPMVTLWHFTNPVWFEELGGWAKRGNIKYFLTFVKAVVTELQEYTGLWVVLNEPEVYASMSYANGAWPPGHKNSFASFRVLHNLMAAHKQTYAVMKKINPQLRIGIAKNNVMYHPSNSRLISRLLVKINTFLRNYYILDRLNNYLDFVGINYYFDEYAGIGAKPVRNEPVSDLGWSLVPESITDLICDVYDRYQKPVYITENGLADMDDLHRGEYIRRVLPALQAALARGADLRGYFHWSLLDNFEWAEGFWPRFGLIEINYATQARRIRESAKEFKKFLRYN